MVILQNSRQAKISEGKLPDPIKPCQTASLEHMVKHRHEYDEYLAKANLLDFSKLPNKGLPALDHGLLSALIDRWSPITNTFHFPFGEMTPTFSIDSVDFLKVRWQPYEDTRDEKEPGLCFQDKDVWRAKTLLNYFWIVEPHNVHRVKKQFGEDEFEQTIEDFQVPYTLGRSEKDWSSPKRAGPKMWDQSREQVPEQKSDQQPDDQKYKEYLKWLQDVSFVDFTFYLARLMDTNNSQNASFLINDDVCCERVVKRESNDDVHQFIKSIGYSIYKLTEDVEEYLKVGSSSKENGSALRKAEDILARLKNITNRFGFYSMPQNVMLEESCMDEEDENDNGDEESDKMQDYASKTKRQWICKAIKSSEEKDEEKRKTKRQR